MSPNDVFKKLTSVSRYDLSALIMQGFHIYALDDNFAPSFCRFPSLYVAHMYTCLKTNCTKVNYLTLFHLNSNGCILKVLFLTVTEKSYVLYFQIGFLGPNLKYIFSKVNFRAFATKMQS